MSGALGALCAACGGEGGSVHIFAGSALTGDPVLTMSGDCELGEELRSLGDFDGDGGSQLDAMADLVLTGRTAAVGDLDGDGVADLAVGDRDANSAFPVRIFFGGPAIDDVADLEISGDGDRFGGALAYLRSFDGGPALAIAAPGLCVY